MFTPINAEELTWTNKYECYKCVIRGGFIVLKVSWIDSRTEKSGYKVAVNEVSLTNLFYDLETAKTKAVALAVRLIKESAVALCSDLE